MSSSLKLGITKIGDLLLHNKITSDKSDNSIDNINLKLPLYQRPYKWTPKNVIQLMDDIQAAQNDNKETYRVGTLILYHNQQEDAYEIVDGQQRTITFCLFIKALNENAIIRFLEQDLADNQYNKHNVSNNFRTLERRVNNIVGEKDKKSLLDYVENNCELIVVITDDISEAFQFFDSQNARGKKLYPHDLLKAYHLREMNDMDANEIEKVVKSWEDLPQKDLSALFNEYLYRVKEWVRGNRAEELTEHNIHIFKGITRNENYPFAQFYKGAYAYSDMVNNSTMPFVAGICDLNAFQIDTPIVAGKPFFDYANHYFSILADIQKNDKYEGYFIKENDIIKTLNLRNYKNGVGNCITRLLFDTAILLYVDRFCLERPTKTDSAMLEQFIVFAFIWAYSMRAQYINVGWYSAQGYIMGNGMTNSFNIYKIIAEADSPAILLSVLSDKVEPLSYVQITESAKKSEVEEVNDGVEIIPQNYLYFFKEYKFIKDDNDNYEYSSY